MPEHPSIGQDEAVDLIDESLHAAVTQDDALGATGEVVAVLGFSQGAKLAASVLYRQQVLADTLGPPHARSTYRFGVLLAGTGPIIDLLPPGELYPALPADATQISDHEHGDQTSSINNNGHVLSIPTIHVHGLQDPGLERHRRLYEDFCDPDGRSLVEWDGDHRVPLKHDDVERVAGRIRRLAVATGVCPEAI